MSHYPSKGNRQFSSPVTLISFVPPVSIYLRFCICSYIADIHNFITRIHIIIHKHLKSKLVYLIFKSLRPVDLKFSFKSPWRRNLNRGICHTPIFDLRRHWHVSFDATFIHRLALIDLCISVKISAERYFKIPHFGSESGPLLSVFVF